MKTNKRKIDGRVGHLIEIEQWWKNTGKWETEIANNLIYLDVFPFLWYTVCGFGMTVDVSYPFGWNGKGFTTQFTC